MFSEDEVFSPLDVLFGDFLGAHTDGPATETVALLGRILSWQTSRKNLFIDLKVSGGKELVDENDEGLGISYPAYADAIESLRQSRACGAPGEFTPLVLVEERYLYLYRYWFYEGSLAESLGTRVGSRGEATDAEVTGAALQPSTLNDAQMHAVRSALENRLTVVTGGPGTGKTTIVATVVTEALRRRMEPHQIAISAPTGKSATRLGEALAAWMQESEGDETSRLHPQTLHRLLGMRRGTPRPRYHENNPLPQHLVIVDEASMIDLALMQKLFAALRPEAKVLLLGDHHQLASVEAGSVLADIVAVFRGRASERSDGCWIELTKNHRFASDGGIARLAAAINVGNAREAVAALSNSQGPELTWFDGVVSPKTLDRFRARILSGYQALQSANSPESALAALSGFQVLCPHRHGPAGVSRLNGVIEQILESAGVIEADDAFYHLRPVLIVENTPSVELFNGDLGVCFRSGDTTEVLFPGPEGIRRVSPLMLPRHETAFAMTVHKSQGSEFGEVLLVMPEAPSRVTTRELLYTAVTRARNRVEIWSSEACFQAAVEAQTLRSSRLASCLRDALERRQGGETARP